MTFEEILDQAMAMLQRRGRLEYRKFKRPFPPPASLASAPLPPAGASPPPALAAAGPRRRARPGRKPGDGPPLRRGLLGGDCPG